MHCHPDRSEGSDVAVDRETDESIRYTRLQTNMRRSILLFMLGMFCTTLLSAAISVYMFHDVDQDKIGHWNEAFAGLCAEGGLFTLIVGGAVGLLTFLGRHLLHLKDYSSRANLSLFLGIVVTLLQYPWDFAGRMAFPKSADFSLSLYMIVAIVLSTIVLLGDNFRQRRLGEAG
jgi:hypothetical protein